MLGGWTAQRLAESIIPSLPARPEFGSGCVPLLKATFLQGNLPNNPSCILFIATSSCPFGSRSGKVVASSWALHQPLLVSFNHPAHKWVNGTLIQLSPVICCKCIYTRTLIKTVLLPTLQRAHCKNLLFSVFYSRPKFWDVLPSTTSPVLPLRLIFTDNLELAKKHKILWEHATLFHVFLWMHFSPNGQGYALIISVTWVLIRDPNTYENTLPCLRFRARVTPHVNHSASCKPLPSVGWITILQGCNRKAHEPNGLHSLLEERRMVTNENLNNRLQECPATILITRKLFLQQTPIHILLWKHVFSGQIIQ